MYKVIKILDTKTILIDYGSDKGAKEKEKIQIVEKGEDIYDSDGMFLDTLDILKDTLEIVRVENKFSLCQKITVEDTNPYLPILKLNTKVEKSNILNVNEHDVLNIKYQTSNPIKVGDLVKIKK